MVSNPVRAISLRRYKALAATQDTAFLLDCVKNRRKYQSWSNVMKPKELAEIRARAIAEADKGEWDSAHHDRVALLAYVDRIRLPDQTTCSHAKLSPFVSARAARFCLKCGKQVGSQPVSASGSQT